MSQTAPVSPHFPALTMAEAHARLTAPGAPFEMETVTVDGVTLRTYTAQPPHIRAVLEASRAHGAKDFIVFEDERITFEHHFRAVARLAQELKDIHSVQKGDRVVLAMRNFPEWSVAFFAVIAVGAVVVPLNAWGTGPELEYGLSDSGARLAILDEERMHRLMPHFEALDLDGVIVARAGGEIPSFVERFEDLVEETAAYGLLPDRPLPDVDIQPDDNATIFYTSGTTGKPKGALGTHRNFLTNLMNLSCSQARAALRRGEEIPQPDPDAPQRVLLLSVPLFHATGCHSILVPNLFTGTRIVMMYKWEPVRAMELIEREGGTHFGGVPAMVWQVLEHPRFREFDLSSVQSISYGGAPAAPGLVRRIAEAFPHVQAGNGYGLTEISSAVSQNVGDDYRLRPDSVGVVFPVNEAKVVNEAGEDLPVGGVGELWLRGPNVVKGYWNKPEATEKTFGGGWLKTGDVARMDEEGFIFILDRAKDMLIRGGENIYCVEVEDALYSHDAVMDAAVVGIPHDVLGEEVGAIVQVTPGARVTQEQLQAYVRERLAGFKVPVRIEIREEPLPRNPNGKILKRQLRDEFLGA
ncbi:MAG: class I adenylate-forming enzyme family protein [Alphaproteobacteria bacterium]